MGSYTSFGSIEGFEGGLFNGFIPSGQSSQGKPLVGSMLVNAFKLHCQLVGCFKAGVIMKQDFCPDTLGRGPLVFRLEKQIPAPGQQLFVGVSIVKLYGFITMSGFLCQLHFPVFQLKGFPPVGNTHLLQGFHCQLLDMETVRNKVRRGETPPGDQFHVGCHVQGYFLHLPALAGRHLAQILYHRFSRCSLNNGYNRTFTALCFLVGDNRIEFVITQSSFIDTQAGAYILGEKQVVPGVFACPPLVKTGKMAPIPFFKPFAIQMEEFTQGGTVDRLTIEIVLLKKRRTRGSGECRQLLQPSHACRDHPFACPASGDGEPARCNPCP